MIPSGARPSIAVPPPAPSAYVRGRLASSTAGPRARRRSSVRTTLSTTTSATNASQPSTSLRVPQNHGSAPSTDAVASVLSAAVPLAAAAQPTPPGVVYRFERG